MRIGLAIALLAGIALWFEGNRGKDQLFVDRGGTLQFEAKRNRTEFVGIKNLSPIGVAPYQRHSFLLLDVFCIFDGETYRSYETDTVWPDWRINNINRRIRARKVLIVGDLTGKVVYRNPWEEMSRSRSAGVVELSLVEIPEHLSILVGRDNKIETLIRDGSLKLFSRVNLGIISNFPLLINEKIAEYVSKKQKPSEQSNGASPFYQVPMGIAFLIIGCALVWWSIRHAIFSPFPRITFAIGGLCIAALILIFGLSMVFP
jgi:hypothetical protein